MKFHAAFFAIIFALGAAPAQADTRPRVAVSNLEEPKGSPWWGSSLDPSIALADLLSDQLSQSGAVTLVDRQHVKELLVEMNNSSSGNVTPDSEDHIGRMVGVRYLIVGKIAEFAQGSGPLGRIRIGNVGSSKVSLTANVEVLDVESGVVLGSGTASQSRSSVTFDVSGPAGSSYTSSDFKSSAVGSIFVSVADDLSTKVLAFLPKTATSGPQIRGMIIGRDDDSYILNVGTNAGVSEGMTFDTLDIKSIFDPTSNKTIRSEVMKGSIQIISATSDSSVAKKIDGIVRVGQSTRAH